MRAGTIFRKVAGVSVAAILGAALLAHPVRADESELVQAIVDTYAKAALDGGIAVGIGVGVVHGAFRHGYAYGLADGGNKIPFHTDSVFEIASNTKVFTTNLLGQAVYNGGISLADPLSQYHRQIGTLQPLTATVTLEEVGDFTGGMADLAPQCAKSSVPGCLPSARPAIADYGATQFLAFFQNTVPQNYNDNPPSAVTSLPAPYFYSDFSTGLLGLLLGAEPHLPITDKSVGAWFATVQQKIVFPLGMRNTYLDLPKNLPADQIALGYSLALASATVSNGRVSTITLTDGGHNYSNTPGVKIGGGGGSGATADAVLHNGSITSIKLVNRGNGYLAPPAITLDNGGSTATAKAEAIVDSGTIKAIAVISPGSGYVRAPTVTIAGGRKSAGRDAVATARIANGKVVAFTVIDGGAGYVDPLHVTIEPGDPESNVIPIWAPAGALSSTIDDMTVFAAAALGETKIGKVALPKALTAGFKTAEKPYACTGKDPNLVNCPKGTFQSGLAWQIRPADVANDIPEIIDKNGGLAGFSSQIVLIPDAKIAVVVFANSESKAPAQILALNLAYQLLNALR